MCQYTTGEIAKLCGVSVRTVQYYDSKNILNPSAVTEGGRRIYNAEDAKKLQTICMLKALGLKLQSVKDIMESENPKELLLVLLDEQAKQIKGDIENRQNQLESIKIVQKNILDNDLVSVNSLEDIERIANSNKRLKKARIIMLSIGIFMDVIQLAAIIVWIVQGIWQYYAAAMAVSVVFGIILTAFYYNSTEYICPKCGAQFKPPLKSFLFSAHTPKTRKLKCPKCGAVGFCAETAAEEK